MNDFYDFRERLQFSEGVEITAGILRHVHMSIPAARKIEKATCDQDRNGTDYWVLRHHGLPPVSIDLKNREFCPIERFGKDDVCIETTSVYLNDSRAPFHDAHRHKPGWTVDERKRTDLLIYTWPHAADLFGEPRLRYWILYFPMLCMAAKTHWRTWAGIYGEKPTPNDGYVTLNVYVPRIVVAKAIKSISTGVIGAA
ncbi:MAG: hypothetical protein ACT443_15805 [Gemmatimonadota bacterium]